ncbi:protein-export chaperone SecB [Ferrovum sp. PN-J185]|uniref:protein-export chaperone SecB n=1 Tax=Ferrovum sp. PN-J185 TaxID=1356306 RepID=UPI000792B337|nr:protein-export chaperone SecB [Ferrovum sp. PN-J185]KXW55419.1 protein-export protein SecB [Ferrovum sp. PN-J185]
MSDAIGQPVFAVEKFYVVDASLEIPHAPQIFLERETPQLQVELSNQHNQLESGLYHTTVKVTVTAKLKDKVMFLVEATQGGVFRIEHLPQEDMDIVLNVTCPNMLFPYLREVISDLVVRAGFPPVILNPVNFEALYQQRNNANNIDQVDSAQITQ